MIKVSREYQKRERKRNSLGAVSMKMEKAGFGGLRGEGRIA